MRCVYANHLAQMPLLQQPMPEQRKPLSATLTVQSCVFNWQLSNLHMACARIACNKALLLPLTPRQHTISAVVVLQTPYSSSTTVLPDTKGHHAAGQGVNHSRCLHLPMLNAAEHSTHGTQPLSAALKVKHLADSSRCSCRPTHYDIAASAKFTSSHNLSVLCNT